MYLLVQSTSGKIYSTFAWYLNYMPLISKKFPPPLLSITYTSRLIYELQKKNITSTYTDPLCGLMKDTSSLSMNSSPASRDHPTYHLLGCLLASFPSSYPSPLQIKDGHISSSGFLVTPSFLFLYGILSYSLTWLHKDFSGLMTYLSQMDGFLRAEDWPFSPYPCHQMKKVLCCKIY